MTEKKKYDKPSMKVYELKQQSRLLAGSGVGKPADYPNQGDPWANP